MTQAITLSLNGDPDPALVLSSWLRHGASHCQVDLPHSPPKAGEKGIDLTATLVISLLGTPAVAQLIDCLKAYITTRPKVTVTLRRADGATLGVIGHGTDPEQVGELATKLGALLDSPD